MLFALCASLLHIGCLGGSSSEALGESLRAADVPRPASAGLPRFAFGSLDGNGAPGNEDVRGIGGWVLGNFESWHASSVRNVASQGKSPIIYLYISAKSSGLQDCNVGAAPENTLCHGGANYIRTHMGQIVNLYINAARGIAGGLGGKHALVHVEPDWYQYSSSDQTAPFSPQESAGFMNKLFATIKSNCPACEIVADISPWTNDLKGYFASWDRSAISYGGLVGKRFSPGGADGKSYGDMAQALGKPLVISDTYGAGGGSLSYNYQWDDLGTLDKASSTGVAVLIQPNTDANHYRGIIDGYRKHAGSANNPDPGGTPDPTVDAGTDPVPPGADEPTTPSVPDTQPPAGAWGFTASGNISESWAEVKVQAPQGTAITKVEAVIDNTQYRELYKTAWGTYGRSISINRGSSVVFRAWDQAGRSHESSTMKWLGDAPSGNGGGQVVPSTPWGFSVSPNISQTWLEVTVTPPSGAVLTKVEAVVDGRQWITLAKTSWGSYGASGNVAGGASVVFRAWDNAGKSHDSSVVKWPSASSQGTGNNGSTSPWGFSLSGNVNQNWIEVTIQAPTGFWTTKVEAIINNQQWVTLPKTNWGAYGSNTYVARGANVVFRAWDQTGKSHDSRSYSWLN